MARDRLYFREDRGWYMDLRDVGGGQKACIPPGEQTATDDRDEALMCLGRRLEALKGPDRASEADDPLLRVYMERHLEVKAGYRAASTVKRDRQALANVLDFFGRDIRISEIEVRGLTDYVDHRLGQPGVSDDTTIAPQTVLHELHALSSLYKRAVAEKLAPRNPVRHLPEKPKVRRDEATWLEPGEAWRLLEACAAHDASKPPGVWFLEPLVATFLLTGGRKSEVFGLLTGDIDFVRGIVHFRPNEHRGLKRDRHRRHVPLWPQLEQILERRFRDLDPSGPDDLLFPSPVTGRMLSNVRTSLDKALRTAGIEKDVSLHTFRHTYTATRLQTTDAGAPVSLFTVARELGHSSTNLIERTYGHLQNTRHRLDVVEYRQGQVVGEIEPEEARDGATAAGSREPEGQPSEAAAHG